VTDPIVYSTSYILAPVIGAGVSPVIKLFDESSIGLLLAGESNVMTWNEPWGAVVDGVANGNIVNEKTPV
jgi:hypothetical protein